MPPDLKHAEKSPRDPAQTARRILIIAGESSGDAHGARLVLEILRREPDTILFGIGGDAMEKAGARLLLHASRLSVVGVVEVVERLPEILKAFRQIKKILKTDPPDLVVLIDFPDFNLRVARRAARRKIPVIYYISPQLWAWRRGRIHQIAKTVKHMLVIFPFEKYLYEKHGVPVTYVGHPLMDHHGIASAAGDRVQAIRSLGLSPLYPVLGLFPGSRAVEVRSLLPDLLQTARELGNRYPRMQFLLGEAQELDREIYDKILEACPVPVTRVRTGIVPVVDVCDLALVASGTATLEVALFSVPMIVVYRVSRLTYWLGRVLIRVPAIGMVNLVPQKGVVPELIQGDVNPSMLLEHCLRFFSNSVYYFSVKNDLARTRDLLGNPGASDRAAQVILEFGKNARDGSA
jgi:lipid-A-disaccharide synthase